MEVKGVYLTPDDNVVMVTSNAGIGDVVTYQSEGRTHSVAVTGDIPVYHKMAVAALDKGEVVVKYGERIGVAAEDIPQGAHIHTHNLVSQIKS